MEVRNNVSFGANLVSPAMVKLKVGKKWKDVDVNFIKFDTGNKEDVSALHRLASHWDKKNLSGAICEEADILGRDAQIYAITVQRTDFNHVVPQSILGVMSTDKIGKAGEDVQIFKIGTSPNFAYEQKRRSRDIKHIARTMVDAFRDLVKRKSNGNVVVNYADPNELKFLAKVGLSPKGDIVEIISGKNVK